MVIEFGTVDIKDAFLMVDQEIPMAVSLLGKMFRVCKNLPGQRLGAKAWCEGLVLELSEHADQGISNGLVPRTTLFGSKRTLLYHVACG